MSPAKTSRTSVPVLRRLAASLTLKLVALIGLFVALPIVLYGQFESADSQMQSLVTRAIQDRSALIAEALTPVLRDTDPAAPMNLNRELEKYSSSGTVLKLMYQPPAARTASRFYLVGSAPPLAPEAVTVELEELSQRGILQRLSEACTWNASDEMRYRRAWTLTQPFSTGGVVQHGGRSSFDESVVSR